MYAYQYWPGHCQKNPAGDYGMVFRVCQVIAFNLVICKSACEHISMIAPVIVPCIYDQVYLY